MTCDEVVKQVLSGDIEAYRYIVTLYHRPLYYFVLGKLTNESEAEDIVQRTFVTAFDKLSEFDSRLSMIVWLRGIALNYCRNEWKSIERQARLRGQLLEVKKAELNLQNLDTSNGENEERLSALRQCLEALSSAEQRLVRLRFVEDASLKSMAESFNKEAEAIRHHLFRIRKRLKACIQGRLSAEGGS